MMDANIVDKFRQVLSNRRNIYSRFKITELGIDDLIKCIQIAYRFEVENRRLSMTEDQETIEKINKAAKWLTGDYKPGLLLYGGVGNGKTTLAKAICNTISTLYYDPRSDKRKEVYRVTALDITRAATDSELFNSLKSKEMLFIDDVGTEPTSIKNWGNEISPVTELLYSRYDRLKFTLITSNLNDDELRDRYGLRIADRMTEMFEKIYFSNRSYRK